MTRHPTARRVHRPDTSGDDAFVANVLETSVWARQHARTLIVGGLVVAAVALFAFFYVSNRRSREERATTELTPMRALVQAGQAQQAIPRLEAFLNTYGGTRSGTEARLLLGQQYLLTGQPRKAIDAIEPVDDDFQDPAAVNAAVLQAAAHEALQEPHRAEEILLRVGEGAPFLYQQHDALDNVGRLRLARGDAAGAAEIYQRLVEATPEANQARQVWQLRLAEARAAIGVKQGS
jgi:predicted negative regulator of RcsB-dependent stress response